MQDILQIFQISKSIEIPKLSQAACTRFQRVAAPSSHAFHCNNSQMAYGADKDNLQIDACFSCTESKNIPRLKSNHKDKDSKRR